MNQATNSLGWYVEEYHSLTGWVGITQPRATIEEAQADLKMLPPAAKGIERRVYEALQ